MDIGVFYGVDSKIDLFKREVKKLNLTMQEVCYIGNDVNDLECIKEAGIGVVVADTVDYVKETADYTTKHLGGKGAFREIVELILYSRRDHPYT